MQTDEELYRSLKSGELAAFDILYERHKLGLYSFIHSYVKNAQEAEDVFHETFMKVLRDERLTFSDGGSTLKGWLFFVARNACLNRLRSEKRWNTVETTLLNEPTAESEKDAEAELIDRNLYQALTTKIRKLPPESAELLKLRLSGLTNHEIAHILGSPLGTIKSRFHALIAHLRKEFI